MVDQLYRSVPTKLAIICGIVAFALGLALVAGAVALDDGHGATVPGDEGNLTASDPGAGTVATWTFLSAQFVPLEERGGGGLFGTQATTTNYLSAMTPSLPTVLYRSIPIAVLFVGAFLVAWRGWNPIRTEYESMLSGAAVTLGYFPLVAVSAWLVTHVVEVEGADGGVFPGLDAGETVTYAAPLGEALLFAGLIYPILVGTIAGYLAWFVRSRVHTD